LRGVKRTSAREATGLSFFDGFVRLSEHQQPQRLPFGQFLSSQRGKWNPLDVKFVSFAAFFPFPAIALGIFTRQATQFSNLSSGRSASKVLTNHPTPTAASTTHDAELIKLIAASFKFVM
jgi:hypothetical protein